MFRQDYLFWKVIQGLQNGGYRILQLSKSNQEVWLESTDKDKPRIIRMLRHDLDWSNWMQRDMEITTQRLEQLRKKLYLRKLDALNIYITTYPPVDDWQFRIEAPLQAGGKGQTLLHTILIKSEDVLEGLGVVSKQVNLPLTYNDESLYIDQEMLEKVRHDVISVANKRISQEKNLFQNGKPFFTYFLVALQLIMFGILELNGGSTNTNTLIKYGAKENFLILNGEWWRFFTPIVLHIGIFHLLMNTLALYYLGTEVEKLYGKGRFLFIYLFAGFTGSLASFVFSSSVSAGASGAIFGCFGALLFFGIAYPSLFFRTMGTNVIGVIVINLVFGFLIPGIDNAGHIGGLVGGFLASSIMHLPKHKKLGQRIAGLAAAVLVLAGLLYVGYVIQPQSDSPHFVVSTAQKHLEANEFEEAYKLLTQAEEKGTTSPQLYFYMSFAEIKLGKFEDAKDHLLIVTEEEPTISEAHYNLALVYMQLKDYHSAKQSAERAVEENPDNESYKELISEIETIIEPNE
ncbi:rhomboid family intramembrane serine protease [Fredinandcohnia sp. 179-A 10B2 NHS]|uniref:rhomboid family intramembrane serine protease n=1 Tax=Fredinandcohnia sp. 179-A 10B2 NHS TaxID=3235176 RepID=UPI0039A05C9D